MRTSRRSSLAGAGKIPGCPLGETMSIKQRFEQEPIYLMDGSAFVYRGFYANQSMQRSDGFPTSALFIVARILMRILREEQPKHFAFVLDGHGPNFRHELFPLYKAQRSATPEDLIKQIDPIHRLIKALGLHLEVSDSCEADDCLASLAKRYREERPVILVATDKDLKQCLHDNVMMWDPASRDEKIVTLKSFEEETGLKPTQWPDVQAIIGDSSDNIPGVRGVGPKTAEKLFHEYASLEAIRDGFASMKPALQKKFDGQLEAMFLYRQLTTLDTSRCASLTLDAMRVRPVNRQEAATLLREFELSSLERELATLIRDGRVAVEHDASETVDSGKSGSMRQLSLLDTPKAEPRQRLRDASDPFFDALEAEIVAGNEGAQNFKTLAMTQVRMSIYFKGSNYDWTKLTDMAHMIEEMDKSQTRLVLYTNYKTLSAIPDYAYAYEQNYSTTLAYGGYINRSRGCYVMDITGYAQSLWNSYQSAKAELGADAPWDELKEKIKNRTIYLGPEAYSVYTTTYSVLQGMTPDGVTEEDVPIKIDVTYNLIK